MQNLLYALIQSVHNLGAVTIVGVSAYGLFFSLGYYKRILATVLSLTWGVQGLTGGTFGLTTFYYYHQLPDIHGVAIIALVIKIICVMLGFSVAAIYAIWCSKFSPALDRMVWALLFFLGLLALSSAAFLRWFS